MRRTPAIVPIVLYGVLALVVVPVFPHGISPNEFSRWALDVAIVDFHTFEISRVIALGIPLGDIATKDGKTYSNKVPGSSLVVLPAYALTRAILGPASPSTMRVSLTALRIAGATIPTILLAIWFGAVARRFGIDEKRIAFATATMLFGTVVFTYGLLFFSHALSTFALFGAWALLFVWRTGASPVPTGEGACPPQNAYAAGALIGIAVLNESAPVFAGAALIACAYFTIGWRGVLRVIAGGVPLAILFFGYNWITFGGPLALPFYFDVDAHIRNVDVSGFLGLNWPVYMKDILLDPGKGVLVLSPVLLMALHGLRRAKAAMPKPAFVGMIVVPLFVILPIAGYPYWFGGRCVGVRYIEPVVPFLALLIAFATPTVIEVVLLGASVVTIAILSLVFPFVPTIYAAPWASFSWPLLRDGCVAPNLVHFISRPMAIAVPFLLVIVAVVFVVPLRRVALLVAGAVLWLAIGFLAEARHPSNPALRVLIEEVHFQRRDLIQQTFPPTPAAIALKRSALALERLPPPEWPY
ncbi:MAG TPA: hypothetical protein VLU46_11995 [Thermoanaerobaculia bacterium]|nr:hypothetical protein [Thermoanaerobaculia bacterium]